MTLAQITAIRKRLNADKRFALNLTATRPVPVWPAYLVRPAGLRG